MNKNIAIVVGIIVVGAVLYASGVFSTGIEEPIKNELVGGSFKHVVVVEYADGTTETISDSNLGSIWYDGAEISNIKYFLYVKPMNSATTTFTKVDMAFPATFKMIYDLDCTGGDAFTAGIGNVISNEPAEVMMHTTGFFEHILGDFGYFMFDVDTDFQQVGWATIEATALNDIVGTSAIGHTGIYELRSHYVGDASFKIHTTEATPGYTTPAPLVELTITISTEPDGSINDLLFDWDMGL